MKITSFISGVARVLLMNFFLFPLMGHSQKNVDCSSLQNGHFYSYPKNSNERFLSVRENDLVHEYNLEKRDSTLWKIDWSNDCTYSLKYISGNTGMEPEVETFLKKHKMVYRINNVTNDYYVYNSYIDKVSRDFIQSDTMWRHEKTNVTNTLLFQSIPNRQTLRKAHFSDTTKYAVVYIYRPGKITNSLGDYFLYFDNEPMCVMKNKSGYMFKLFKEGDHEFTSRLRKDSSSATVKVQYGKSYYVKSMINWGFFKGRNFKLEMQAMPPADGKMEFEEVDY